MHDSLAVRLGGRASELLVLGEASTGASNDLSGATELAIHMVRDWGLSPRLGPVGFGSDGPAYLGSSAQLQSRPYAEGTQQAIDEEVTRLLSEAEERARSILSEHRAALDAVVDLLLQRETISGEELAEVVERSGHNGAEAPDARTHTATQPPESRTTGSAAPTRVASSPTTTRGGPNAR